MSGPRNETVARALALVDPFLIANEAKGWSRRALSLWLPRRGVRDQAFADELAARSAPEIYALECGSRDLLTWIRSICEATIFVERGRDRLWSSALALRVAHVVDLDTLVCLSLFQRGDTRYGWSVIPALELMDCPYWTNTSAAETHIHLGGTLPPLYYWILAMGCEYSPLALKRLVGSVDVCAPWLEWRNSMYAAAWERLRLADIAGVTVFRSEHKLDDELEWLRRHPPSPMVCRHEVLRASVEFRLAWGIRHRRFADPLRDVDGNDPNCHYATGERRFLIAAGKLLQSWDTERRAGVETPLARPFADRLLRYIRVKNAFHQLLTHEEGSEGLTRFIGNFSRRGAIGHRKSRRTGWRSEAHSPEEKIVATARASRRRKYRRMVHASERLRLREAAAAHLVTAHEAEISERGRAVPRGVSFRVAPERGAMMVHAFHAWMTGWLEHLERFGVPEHSMGLIVHFLKSSEKSDEVRARQVRRQARSLMNLLESVDGPRLFNETLRRFVVGIDAAGLERATQPRIFAPAFDDVRVRVDGGRRSGARQLSLGYTFHVGEDCWDVMNGLRHIDETRCLLFRHRRGRFGHGLILADDPMRLYAKRGEWVEITRGRHVLDLVWAIKRLELRCDVSGQTISWLEARLRACCGEVAGPGEVLGTRNQLEECWDAMNLDARDPNAARIEQETGLLSRLGLHTAAAREGFVRVEATPAWIQACTELQQWLRKACAYQGITIESNPTSNVLVGGYGDWKWLPYDVFIADSLPVSLNSDDPGIFLTTLPNEYERMLVVQRDRLGSAKQAERWLEDRLRDAERSSFLTAVPAGRDAARVLGTMIRGRSRLPKIGAKG